MSTSTTKTGLNYSEDRKLLCYLLMPITVLPALFINLLMTNHISIRFTLVTLLLYFVVSLPVSLYIKEGRILASLRKIRETTRCSAEVIFGIVGYIALMHYICASLILAFAKFILNM